MPLFPLFPGTPAFSSRFSPCRAGSLLALALLLGTACGGFAQDNQNVVGEYDPVAGDFVGPVDVINNQLGAGFFYGLGYFGQNTVIANVEAGLIWDGHEVFDRTSLGLPNAVALTYSAVPDPQIDYHATMVGHVLAGVGYEDGNYNGLQTGMAPKAQLWSGAIATSFVTDPESSDLGSFDTDDASFLAPYKAFFNGSAPGADGRKADVINSSWGYSDDPAGKEFYAMATDGLARQNPTVTFVVAAGNDGPTAGSVSGFSAGYNNIAVASLGAGSDGSYLTPSDFSSAGPADFYNPATKETIKGVRATVAIAAPGENEVLAYYGGATGTLAEIADPQYATSTDLYLVNQSGTSFAAPTVAGGVSLLKDLSYGNPFLDTDEARDTRVIRSVLMAGAVATVGWNNGQTLKNGVISTTQSLDYQTGAGRMDLTRSGNIYAFGTADVAGTKGGTVSSEGWDFGSVDLGTTNDYLFDNAFAGDVELTISLNWFVNRSFDNANDTAAEGSFANLDLEIWSVSETGVFENLIATSDSLYNNSEFLRFVLPQDGYYGFKITFEGVVYDLGATADQLLTSEEYGVAWDVEAIPEPSTWALFGVAVITLTVFRKRRKAVA